MLNGEGTEGGGPMKTVTSVGEEGGEADPVEDDPTVLILDSGGEELSHLRKQIDGRAVPGTPGREGSHLTASPPAEEDHLAR